MQVPVLPLRPLWHLGALHPFEQLLTVLLAFGPFLVLGIVVWRRRKADAAEERSARCVTQVPRRRKTPHAPLRLD